MVGVTVTAGYEPSRAKREGRVTLGGDGERGGFRRKRCVRLCTQRVHTRAVCARIHSSECCDSSMRSMNPTTQRWVQW